MADAGMDAGTYAGHDAGADARFGGLTPSEAAQRRWAKDRADRAREVAADNGDADAIPTDAEIIEQLRRKAGRGDTNAARELREWESREAVTLQGDAWLGVLNEEERELVMGTIETALERHGAPVA